VTSLSPRVKTRTRSPCLWNLDARAVHLPFERNVTRKCFDRFVDIASDLGEHRCDG
jgi:hypothetical protein